jgi:hypothetical protein
VNFGVVEIAGDQIEGSAPGRPGGYEKDITDEVLGKFAEEPAEEPGKIGPGFEGWASRNPNATGAE